MSKKSENAKELFRQGYNCAQSVIGVFCEELGLDFNTAMKISCPFGGGMGRMREVCGAVSGLFIASGLAFSTADSSHENKTKQYKIVQELAKRFKEKNGSIICKELLHGVESSASPLPSERTSEYYRKRPCINLVADAVEIFEEIMQELKIKNLIN